MFIHCGYNYLSSMCCFVREKKNACLFFLLVATLQKDQNNLFFCGVFLFRVNLLLSNIKLSSLDICPDNCLGVFITLIPARNSLTSQCHTKIFTDWTTNLAALVTAPIKYTDNILRMFHVIFTIFNPYIENFHGWGGKIFCHHHADD